METLKIHLPMISSPPPTGISLIGNHFYCHDQLRYLPSLKKKEFRNDSDNDTCYLLAKIRDMEDCCLVSINLIVKQKSKCVSDFFISTCLLGSLCEWHDRKVRVEMKKVQSFLVVHKGIFTPWLERDGVYLKMLQTESLVLIWIPIINIWKCNFLEFYFYPVIIQNKNIAFTFVPILKAEIMKFW